MKKQLWANLAWDSEEGNLADSVSYFVQDTLVSTLQILIGQVGGL